MVQLSDFSLFVDQAPPFPRGPAEPIPPIPDLDLEMPRVYRRPPPPPLKPAARPVRKLLEEARRSKLDGDAAGFGKNYGALTGCFQPDLQWALSCWDYLLSTQGCRFLARNSQEKLYSRGDYRVFARNDFEGLVYRAFRGCLLDFLSDPAPKTGFERFLRLNHWARLSDAYRQLEDPPDRNQRKLTGYSYLRCVPYRFLNSHHDERVYRWIRRLSSPLRQTVEWYHLSFYREEAAADRIGVEALEFRRRRWAALREIASKDILSFRLLRQIERY